MSFRFKTFKTVLAAASCVIACVPALCPLPVRAATDVGGVELDDSTQVAGRNLKLNGAGISMRLVFKVYAMGLYLLDRRKTPEDVFASDGPRRLMIAMLRDISSEEFDDAVTSYLLDNQGGGKSRIASQMAQLGKAIARQPNGLRKGDLLTLDWVPGTGTVVELNRKPLTEPLRDIAFYNALLSIWLGETPADPLLKTQLLGRPQDMRVSVN